MKTRVVVLSSLLAMSMSAAQAGPCTTEIDNLAKTMASKDAGQGPTPGAGASTSASTPAGQHPPTDVMSKQTQGKSDVLAGRELAEHRPAPGRAKRRQGDRAGGCHDRAGASAALARARQADAQGKEADCMSAIGEAKRLHTAR